MPGTKAGRLYRNLVDHIDSLVVCDPRRNKWIASDGAIAPDASFSENLSEQGKCNLTSSS